MIPVFPIAFNSKSSILYSPFGIWKMRPEVTNAKQAPNDHVRLLWWYNLNSNDSAEATRADDTPISHYNSLQPNSKGHLPFVPWLPTPPLLAF
jgi:hypothetical protein